MPWFWHNLSLTQPMCRIWHTVAGARKDHLNNNKQDKWMIVSHHHNKLPKHKYRHLYRRWHWHWHWHCELEILSRLDPAAIVTTANWKGHNATRNTNPKNISCASDVTIVLCYTNLFTVTSRRYGLLCWWECTNKWISHTVTAAAHDNCFCLFKLIVVVVHIFKSDLRSLSRVLVVAI